MKKTEKKQNNLKVLVVILLVILLSLISFVGIYVKKNGNYKDIIKNYDLGMELVGNRTLILVPDDSTESVTKDAEGNVVENTTENKENQEGYTTEEVPVNDESVLTEENFKKSKEILEKRLDEYKFEEYFIKQDTETGNIILELAENNNTDKVISILNKQGKFEIKDSKSKEVLMDNSMIKDAKVMYNTTTSGTSVYLDIEFNKEGKEKLEQISNDYKTIESTENTDETENSEESDKEEQKEITMEINGETIMTTSFDDPITIGRLQLTVGQASKDTDTLQGYIDQARSTATLLSTGNIPVKYKADTNKYIKADISDTCIKTALITAIAVIALITIALVLKFKSKGLIGAILSIGYIAVSLLVIRYTNVQVSVAGLAALAIITIMNYILICMLISNSNKKEEKEKISNVFGRYIFAIVPIFIISLAFTFANSVLLSSFGMILFWGIILILIYNSIFANIFFKK